MRNAPSKLLIFFLLQLHKEKLERSSSIINLQVEIDTLILTINTLKAEMSSDTGALHLLDVQVLQSVWTEGW